ncbi:MULTISPECIES: hypothetical protein [unclassified Microbacterium]|uniref:hypothetical protein n=1 Tax=unclassified Microbacterium TaxID=2609290 RepID=UPI0028830436|nr:MULTISPECIES: hypothetical protein [unclassified Microbacterium]
MMTPVFPQIPLKDMNAAQLVFELTREAEALVYDEDRLIVNAAMIATHLHRNQTRSVRGDLPRVPYIEHPIRNALRALRFGKGSPQLIAANLLHDTLEDCLDEIVRMFVNVDELPAHVNLETIRGRRVAAFLWMAGAFGQHIADIVLEVSNKVGGTRQDYWMKLATLAERAGGTVPDPVAVDALIVKAMDLLDNAGSLRHQLAAGEDPHVILRRAEKYRPAVVLVSTALRAIGEIAISDALDELEGHLSKIITDLTVCG